MLKGALNKKLRSALTSNYLVLLDDYFELIRILVQIPMQHNELTSEYFADQGLFENIHNVPRDLRNDFSDHRPSKQLREWNAARRE